MNKKIIVISVIIVAIVLLVVINNTGKNNNDVPSNNATTHAVTSAETSVKEFDRVISGFAYNPNSIDVNFGDQVVVNITNNDDVTHGINLPVFGVAEFVEPGTTKRIEFLADKTGSSDIFCSSDHGEKLLINVKG